MTDGSDGKNNTRVSGSSDTSLCLQHTNTTDGSDGNKSARAF